MAPAPIITALIAAAISIAFFASNPVTASKPCPNFKITVARTAAPAIKTAIAAAALARLAPAFNISPVLKSGIMLPFGPFGVSIPPDASFIASTAPVATFGSQQGSFCCCFVKRLVNLLRNPSSPFSSLLKTPAIFLTNPPNPTLPLNKLVSASVIFLAIVPRKPPAPPYIIPPIKPACAINKPIAPTKSINLPTTPLAILRIFSFISFKV